MGVGQDSMPLVAQPLVRQRLLVDRAGLSSFCMAGAARFNVPAACTYGNHLFWKQGLQARKPCHRCLGRCPQSRIPSPCP